jgi:hypothetical protein
MVRTSRLKRPHESLADFAERNALQLVLQRSFETLDRLAQGLETQHLQPVGQIFRFVCLIAKCCATSLAIKSPNLTYENAFEDAIRSEPKTGFEPVTYGLRNRCSTN